MLSNGLSYRVSSNIKICNYKSTEDCGIRLRDKEIGNEVHEFIIKFTEGVFRTIS
jgi:hypothetical protein